MTITADWGTGPKDWSDGHLVTATDMNSYISNRLLWLKSRPFAQFSPTIEYTTSSTTFVDVHSTDFALTITTTGGIVCVGFSGSFARLTGSTNTVGNLDVAVDGVRVGHTDGGLSAFQLNGGPTYALVTMLRFLPGISAGAHTFKLQWKVSGESMVMMTGGYYGAAGRIKPQFWVMEM